MASVSELDNLKNKEKCTLAAILFYGVSVVGLLNLFATGQTTGAYTPLISVDILVYIVMIVLTYLIQKRQRVAMYAFFILAVLWYLALVFFLPERFHHHLDIFVLMVQVALTVFGYFILFTRV